MRANFRTEDRREITQGHLGEKMVDGEHICNCFNCSQWSALLDFMAGKKPALFPVCPKVQSPHHCVLDFLRTPSMDPLGFLRFCKASWLALKEKALNVHLKDL